MSKSDQNAAKQAAKSDRAANTARMSATDTQLQSQLGEFGGNARSMLPGVVSGYSDISSTGGYDPAITGNVNALYKDFMDTGGISTADADAMRTRASDAASSAYKTATANAGRSFAATGGYGDVSGAIVGNLARAGGEAAAKAATDTDASIATARQSGRLAGASGTVGLQQNLVANRLAGTAGLANVYGMNLNEVNATVDNILKNYQINGQLNNQDLAILSNLANQPGVFDKIVGTIGTLGGAAAGVIGAVKPGGF